VPRVYSSVNMPAQAKKAGPKAHKLAEQFPKGSVLKDLFKKEWVLGDVVGQGGFGLIYLASEKDSKSDHVIKIEPKNNGPLFCEMQYYQRVAKADLIKTFTASHKLQYLALPPFMGTGSYEFKKVDYRFLVMPRLGTDLQKLLVESGGTFKPEVVFSVGLRVLDALQFMHVNEYVHADVKAANILQGYKQGKCVTTQVYLVDYGLAYRYVVDGVHKPYKEDPRKAHDGTIEFTSRDAHKGVSPSRRADLEILGYCLLQWLCGKLPWEDKLGDPQYVAQGKERLMSSVSTAVPSCFKDNSNSNSAHSTTMTKFLSHVSSLKYDQAPDYTKIKGWLKEGLAKAGVKDEWKVEVAAKSKATKRKSAGDPRPSPVKKVKATKAPSSKPSTPKKTPRIITPMTPRSPLKSPTKTTPKQRKSPVKSVKKTVVSKAIKTPSSSAKKTTPAAKAKPVKSPVKRKPKSAATNGNIDNSMTSHNGDGDSKSKPSNKRTVKRRADVVKNEVCTQTSPGLAKKRK